MSRLQSIQPKSSSISLALRNARLTVSGASSITAG
jgi:hypothetical protein